MINEDGSRSITYKLYQYLELRPPCRDEDITKAYRKLALKYHPDKATGSAEKFQKIKFAHEILKDPLRKEFYDKMGDKGLELIPPDSRQGGMFGSLSFVERMLMRIFIKPPLLIPFFMFIAFIGFLFVTFVSWVDRKLYKSDLISTPWYMIFICLWVILAVYLVIQSVYLHFHISIIKEYIKTIFESDDVSGIPAPRRRFLSVIFAIKGLVSSIQYALGTLLFFYCTILLAFNLDGNGKKLLNQMTWSAIFYPAVMFFIVFGIIKNILNFFAILRFHSTKRMWKERILVFSNVLYGSISSVAFFYLFGNWLDSTDRSHLTLFLIFSLIYFRIIFYGFRFYCETNWQAEDNLEKKMQRNSSNITGDNHEKALEANRKVRRFFIIGIIIVLTLSTGLIHSHIAGNWPQTWSAALFPILICIYTSMVVFGFCCPCLTICMHNVWPPNAFETFVPAGEEQITVIEIPSFYRFGYGFAPIQKRITHY